MHPTVSQYAQALEELAASATPATMPAIIGNFIGLLKRRGEGRKIGAIVKCLEHIDAQQKGRTAVTAVTAHEATKDVKETLVARVRKLFPNKDIDMRYEVDADVIGGARFRTDGVSYDATIAAELKGLRAVLTK